MTIKINQNIFSMLVQKHLGSTTKRLEQATERISSGQRINRSSDDPAGMATSEQLRYEIQGVRQNQQNVTNAVSMVGVAETNISRMVDILQRGRELTVQAGNDTLSPANRQALQTELSQLMDEVNRISTSSKFGDQVLFTGGFQNMRMQVGESTSEYLSLSLGDHRTSVLGSRAVVTSATAVGPLALSAGQVTINGVAIPASTTDSVSTIDPAASALAKANAINSVESQTGVHATALGAELNGANAIGGINIDGGLRTLTINGISIGPINVTAGDPDRALTSLINSSTAQTGVSAGVDAGGRLTLSSTDGRNIEVRTTGSVAQALGLSAAAGNVNLTGRGRIELSSSQAFAVSDPTGTIGLAAGMTVMPDASTALNSANLTTVAGATRAMQSIDTAIEQLSNERSRLGALNNRLEQINDTLARRSEELAGADSRIRDTDFALETARLTQAQILQEASIAMLAQANITPKRALELLQG